MDRPMRLTSELVPEGVWFDNLRTLVPKKEWDRKMCDLWGRRPVELS